MNIPADGEAAVVGNTTDSAVGSSSDFGDTSDDYTGDGAINNELLLSAQSVYCLYISPI